MTIAQSADARPRSPLLARHNPTVKFALALVLSLAVVFTTDPTDLAISLIVHGRLPFRIVYALLAAYRFLPFFAQEYEQVRLAQRVRGAETGLPARLLAGPRTVVPLLAGAVRRATRIGVA